MSIEVKIPAVGESITSGVLSAWHKQNGDMVNDGEALFTLETDKISTEVPAVGSGKLRIQVDAGQEVKIGQVVALLEDNVKSPAGSGEPSSAESADFASPAANATAPRSAAATQVPIDETVPATSRSGVEQERNETLSPAARRIAEEEKVNLSEVMGTGKHGQVTKSDLVQYLESKSSPPPPAKPSAAPAPDAKASPVAIARIAKALAARRNGAFIIDPIVSSAGGVRARLGWEARDEAQALARGMPRMTCTRAPGQRALAHIGTPAIPLVCLLAPATTGAVVRHRSACAGAGP